MTTAIATAYPPSVARRFARRLTQSFRLAEKLAPFADLALRLWVANAFWQSGLTKIQSWETTVQLFQYEYQVPLLPPELAAYLGTATELGMPILLALGLCGRLSAGVLFVFNIIAVLSYPDLMPAGVEQHQVWGLMLFAIIARGPGKFSFDHYLRRAFVQ